MEKIPRLQKNLYGFNDIFLILKNLFEKKKLSNKILFSGQKELENALLLIIYQIIFCR